MKRKAIQTVSTMGILLVGFIFAFQPAFADQELSQKSGCVACHAVDTKLVGPSFNDIAAKYAGDDGAVAALSGKVKNGGSGVWGQIPMPPNVSVSDENINKLVTWILSLKE